MKFQFLQDHVSFRPMLRNSHAVLVRGMCAGPVAKKFHAFASYCSTREMFMNQLGISVSVARNFHAKEIWIGMYRSPVRSVDRRLWPYRVVPKTAMFHVHIARTVVIEWSSASLYPNSLRILHRNTGSGLVVDDRGFIGQKTWASKSKIMHP